MCLLLFLGFSYQTFCKVVALFFVMQEAQKWKPLSFEKVKNDLVWRGVEVVALLFS